MVVRGVGHLCLRQPTPKQAACLPYWRRLFSRRRAAVGERRSGVFRLRWAWLGRRGMLAMNARGRVLANRKSRVTRTAVGPSYKGGIENRQTGTWSIRTFLPCPVPVFLSLRTVSGRRDWAQHRPGFTTVPLHADFPASFLLFTCKGECDALRRPCPL